MTSPDVRSVFKALDPSEQGDVLFVGGCVRNLFLEREITDIDLATVLRPKQVVAALEAAHIKVVPTGIEHGTVTAVVGGRPFEITTLRCDVDTNGRHAKVEFTDDWYEDAERRDFTMNTLLADLKGNVYDPLGIGVKDAEKKRVIFVGDPNQRIREDYLRVLRFFRFHAVYGEGTPDRAAVDACQRGASGISSLSKERVTSEFLKIVASDRVAEVLDLMRKHKVLASLISSRYDPKMMDRFMHARPIESEAGVAARLFVMDGLRKKPFDEFGRFLILPNRLKDFMVKIAEAFQTVEVIDDHSLKLALYQYDREVTEQVLRLRLCVNGSGATIRNRWIEDLSDLERPQFPVRGEDLIAMGMASGPALGEKLKAMEKRWIKSDFTLGAYELLNGV